MILRFQVFLQNLLSNLTTEKTCVVFDPQIDPSTVLPMGTNWSVNGEHSSIISVNPTELTIFGTTKWMTFCKSFIHRLLGSFLP